MAKVALSPLKEQDLEFLRTLRNDVREWLGTKSIITPEQQQDWYFNSYAQDSGWLVFIAWSGNIPVGYGQIKGHDDDSYEIGCAVHPDHQRLGYGTSIVEWLTLYIIDGMKSRNIWLWVYRHNTAALNLYRKCGFKEIAHIGFNRLRMELK